MASTPERRLQQRTGVGNLRRFTACDWDRHRTRGRLYCESLTACYGWRHFCARPDKADGVRSRHGCLADRETLCADHPTIQRQGLSLGPVDGGDSGE